MMLPFAMKLQQQNALFFIKYATNYIETRSKGAAMKPDMILLEAVSTGDRDALQSLYQRHGLTLLNYLIEMIEDIEAEEAARLELEDHAMNNEV